MPDDDGRPGRTSMTAAARGLVLATLLATAVAAADQVRRERVEFPDGSGTAQVEGTVKGYESVEYQVAAGAGQQMTIALDLRQRLDLLQPLRARRHSRREHGGPHRGPGRARLSGHARGHRRLHDPALPDPRRRPAGRGSRPTRSRSRSPARRRPAPEADAQVPGTEFHATGELRCAVGAGQPMTACPFGVVREGGGTATVHVTRPDGADLTIRFDGGRAVASEPAGRGLLGDAAGRRHVS